MIRKYTIGHPIATESVVVPVPAGEGPLPYFSLDEAEKSLSLGLGFGDLLVLFNDLCDLGTDGPDRVE